jgi:hypothetical protein
VALASVEDEERAVVHDVAPRDRRRDLADLAAGVEQGRGDRIVTDSFGSPAAWSVEFSND